MSPDGSSYLPQAVQLLGALFVGFVGGIGVQAWRARRDELRITCEDFCKIIGEATDLGSNYWSLAKGAELKERSLLEAKLIGAQRKLSGYAALFRNVVHREGSAAIDSDMATVFDLLTGGEFKNPNRETDYDRVIELQVAAAELIIRVRTAFMDKVNSRAAAGRIFRRTIPASMRERSRRFIEMISS